MLRQANAKVPSHAVLWFECGNAASRLVQRADAVCAWDKAIALEPRTVDLRLQVGHQCQGARQPGQAQALFARAATVKAEVRAGLGESLHTVGGSVWWLGRLYFTL